MPHNSKSCEDHDGRTWPSESAMCQYYRVPLSTYKGRLERGWTQKQALTVPTDQKGPKIKPRKNFVRDHLGHEFVSVGAMCRHWGIDEKVYWSRKRICKWPLDKTLTEPVRDKTDAANAKAVTDHMGHAFNSISAMCRHWRIGLSTYRERIKRGWTIEKALTGQEIKLQTDPVACRDHAGREYPSKNAMCAAYGITRYCYDSRIALGWSVEQALTVDIKINAKPCRDHAGKTFPAASYMALYLGFPVYTFQGRNSDPTGMIPGCAEKFWTGRTCGGYHIKTCIDFPWFLAHDNINDAGVVLHFDQILQIYHGSPEFRPLPESKLKNPFVKTVKLLKWPWYLCLIRQDQYVLHYDDLLQTHVDSNYGISPPVQNTNPKERN